MILGIDASQANRTQRSGTEWYAFYLIQEFKKLLRDRDDIQVRLYVRSEVQEDLASNLPKNFTIKKLGWPINFFWAQGRLSLEMLFSRPDILFCPAHTIPLIHPRKTFTTLHDIGFEDYPELYDKLSLFYHKFSARLAVRKAHHIFTISNFSRKRIIKQYNCDPKKISMHYLGFDQKKFRPFDRDEVKSTLAKYKLEYKDYIFYIGRLEPKKNILGMVKGYELFLSSQTPGKQIPKLVLAGRKVNISAVEDYLNDHPELNAQVKFLDYLPERDKPALYSGAALFLFPTFYEGFGLPILEAQSMGVPVITSDRASNPEVSGKGALIVKPKDYREIASSISNLLDDEELRVKLVEGSKKNLERFDWRRVAKETLNKILSADQT